MGILRIYLDTSILNFVFADDAPKERDVTIEFFEKYVKPGVYSAHISPVVIDEIKKTTDERRRSELLLLIEDNNIEILEVEENQIEIESLAQSYIDDGVVPMGNLDDALHVAVATVYEFDILLSWNYRHLANVNKEVKFSLVSQRMGYSKLLRMSTPLELIYEDQ